MVCKGGLPSGPYPGAPIYMQGLVDPLTYIVSLLTYTDDVLGREPIFEREGLCSRAACTCTEWGLVCNNFEYAYFNPTIHHWYRSLCIETCGCRERKPPGATSVTATTSQATITVENSVPNTTAAGTSGCLAGEKGGWTTKQLPKCCPGYTFQAMTPKEVYSLYGLIPNITAAVMGICSNGSTSNLSGS